MRLKKPVQYGIIIGMASSLFVSCMQPLVKDDYIWTAGIIPLQYPVVLVHGIAIHDRTNIINYWGRIPETLESGGVRVFFGNTDAWGSYETNAFILKQTIDDILTRTGAEKVNIIAHSKGGIDSRYLVWKYDFGDKVASLTTICTPHHGAEIADLIYNQKIIHTKFIKNVLAGFGKLYGDTKPDMYNVNFQLTTAHMNEFNEKVIMDDRVYYQSLYTTINSPAHDKLFASTYSYIQKTSGPNDGLVSEYSARWGTNIVKIPGELSHAEITGLKTGKMPDMYVPEIYVGIAHYLAQKGF